jgi:chemotaxis protein CheX
MSPNPAGLSFFNEKVGQCFIKATTKTIESYFGKAPLKMQPMLTGAPRSVNYGVAGVMNFQCHDVRASMVVAFEEHFALQIFETMVGDKLEKINPDVIDCISELTNIIYGAAKSPLSEIGYNFPMARPETTVEVAAYLKNSKYLELPFHVQIEHGKEFALMFVVHEVLSVQIKAS